MCKSLTYAQRTARVLERAGITAVVKKAPQGTTSHGCAYCVKVSENRLRDAQNALCNAGLVPSRVLLQGPDGSYGEVMV
jgi:rhodanese-related sulfurtransferase